MQTFPRTRVTFSAKDIDCSISVGDSGLVQHALSQALRVVLEVGGSAPGVDAIKICEALELFAWIEQDTSGETGQFLRTDYPLVYSATSALIFTRDVLVAAAGNIEAGLCPVPDGSSAAEQANDFRECADWLSGLINDPANKTPDSAYLHGPY